MAVGADVDILGARDDVPVFLGDSDILVFTSVPTRSDARVLIEAGLSGVPVVATDVPGARDVIEHGAIGHIVPADRPEEADHFVTALVGNRTLREDMGRAARERCERDFSLEASVALWESVIDELVQGHHPQSLVERA